MTDHIKRWSVPRFHVRNDRPHKTMVCPTISCKNDRPHKTMVCPTISCETDRPHKTMVCPTLVQDLFDSFHEIFPGEGLANQIEVRVGDALGMLRHEQHL